ncbi:SKA complex subunit 3 [Pagrus major]|uniref:SKA complex subunit 3 n=1 Tax=Pagrus major TaxID=143350 RepID=UPI003CC8C2B9
MDPTSRFFTKLRKLAVTLESETAQLQHTFDNRNKDDGDSEATARGMRALHELSSEVGTLKGQLQEQLTQQKARDNEVSSFIKACRVMQQKVTQDIQAMRELCEKYGYQPPRDTQTQTRATGQQSDAGNEEADESAGEEGESQEEAGDDPSSSSPKAGPPPVTDVLRTPQLSDFGLSEMHLKRAMAGAEWCSEVPPMPEMRLPPPSLNMPASPPMPITPKCALRMDEEEVQTPQMHDFGISEHTMCLLNDFTMDLLQKKIDKPPRPSQDIPVPPVNSLMESLQAKDNMESPELPVFCTPGLKIKKTNGHCSPPTQGNGDPEPSTSNQPTTPDVPVFQTPYVNRMVSTKKSAQQPDPINIQTDDDSQTFKLQMSPRNRSINSKRSWEYNVPEMSISGEEDQMPEMPKLEFALDNYLQNKSAKMLKKTSEHEKVTKEPTVNSLELDGPTQEFSLGTPRLRMDFGDPSTPEMPELSSVTQDICKLVSQAQLKRTAMAIVHPNVKADKYKSSPLAKAVSVSVVSESEFQSLPSYLRQMTLPNLNQTIHNINKFIAEWPGEKTELQMEELRRITNVGTKTPVYLLCLTELKRLTHVGGARDTSVYKLCTRS